MSLMLVVLGLIAARLLVSSAQYVAMREELIIAAFRR